MVNNKILKLLEEVGFVDYINTNSKYAITVGIDKYWKQYKITKDFLINVPEPLFTLSKQSVLLITTKDKDKFYAFLQEEFKHELRKIKINNLLK